MRQSRRIAVSHTVAVICRSNNELRQGRDRHETRDREIHGLPRSSLRLLCGLCGLCVRKNVSLRARKGRKGRKRKEDLGTTQNRLAGKKFATSMKNGLSFKRHTRYVFDKPQPIRAAVACFVLDKQGGDSMKLKDATRGIGSVGILLPLILIFLIAAGATYACPGTRVVYRTRTANRLAPSMGTTVISYGGQPCGDISYRNTRRVRYTTVGDSGYYGSSPRYIAVRSARSYQPARRIRYVAVRNDDMDYTPSRYVVVSRQPTYIDSGSRYIAVRSYAPRTRYVAVRYSDMDPDDVDYNYSPQYVAVRRQPVYVSPRYVPVRNVDTDYDDDDYVAPARYVAVRNTGSACACGVSSLNDVETTAPRHVVVKTDYIAGTRDVIVPRSSYDDTAYLNVPTTNLSTARYVNYDDAAYWDDGNQRYIPASYVETPQLRTVSYVPADYGSDLDDEAIPDTEDATYIAANDVGDACLSRIAVQAPMETSTQTVSYVPADDVDYDTSLSGSEPTYVVNETPTSAISDEPVDADSDMDTDYVPANYVGASCSCPVAYQSPAALRTFEDDLGYHTVTAISADNMTALNTVPVNYTTAENVNYVPADQTAVADVNYVPADQTNLANVNYVPADETNVEPVSDVSADSIGYADTADTDACDCSAPEASVVTEPAAPIAYTSMAVVEPENVAVSTDESVEPRPIAAETGYRDGLADGQAAAVNGQENIPADSENFQTATNGYDDTLGNVNSYGVAYRSSYLQGFSEGYNSQIGP